MLPLDTITLTAVRTGSGIFNDGLLHRKTVPEIIMARVLEGRYEISTPAAHGTVEQGELWLTAPDVPLTIVHHAPGPGGRMRADWIHASFRLHGTIDIGHLLVMPLIVRGDAARELGGFIERMAALDTDSAGGLDAAIRRLEIGFGVLRTILGISRLTPSARHFLKDPGRLLDVFRYVEETYDQPLDIDALAREAHLSRSRFLHMFQEQTGTTPMRYVKQVRIRAAQTLLVTRDLTVAEISARVGFRNPFHFSRAFCSLTGMPPLTYRRTHAELVL